jgi:putative nucleotidyltransferase with HDIG domain
MMKPRGNPRKGKKGAFQLAPQTDHDGGARRWRVQRLLEILAVVVIVAALTREPKRPPMLTEDINRTPVATEEIRAAISFETRDIEATRLAQEKAISDLPDIYRVESARVDEQLALVRAHITLLSEQRGAVRQAVCDALMASTEEDKPDAVARQAVAELAAKLKQRPEWAELPDAAILTEWLLPDAESLPERAFADVPAEPARTVAKGRNAEPTPTPAPAPRKVASLSPDAAGKLTFTASDALAAISLESLEYVLTAGVRVDTQGKAAAAKPVTLRRDRPVDDLPESSPRMPLTDIPALSGAAEKLSLRLQDAAKKAAAKSGQAESWPRLHEAARAMAEPALRDTLRYDMVATAEASERAKEAVPVVPRTIEAGEIIQDRGKRWTEQSREDVRAYLRELESDENPVQRVLTMGAANVLFALLAFAAVRRAISMYTPPDEDDAHRERDRRVNLALLLICVTLCVGRLASYFEPSGFVLPVAAPAILYAILVGGRAAVLVSCVTAMLLSAQYSFDWRLLCIGSAMGLGGIFTIHNVRKRSDMAAASITATLVGLIAVGAITLAMDAINSNAALQRALLIFMNGGLCLLVVPAVLSPLEKLFGITTDITLLEYSDLNNELLKRLAIEAPGTYAHSQVLGQLAEAASDAIGANGLMARVAAYYHDIGKMRRSEYFCENQQGTNIHDELSPRLSARAIAAHVIQGAEMAHEHHLPQPIIDGILEHHGTCLIGYFYQQAQKQQKHGDVKEEDFRYPGPKPQRPETAILMICDAVESGVRSIKNPNEERVREFVDKIIAARNADRQFDDCNLTLKQLDTIAEVVTQRARVQHARPHQLYRRQGYRYR